MKLILYTWEDFDRDVKKILRELNHNNWKIEGIYGVPKGGLPLAVKLANHFLSSCKNAGEENRSIFFEFHQNRS